jgi:magnesium transporter
VTKTSPRPPSPSEAIPPPEAWRDTDDAGDEEAAVAPDVPLVRALAMSAGELSELTDLAAVGDAYRREGTRLWVDVVNADHATVSQLASIFQLHPLIAEDIAERNQRAKIEATGRTLHVVVFALRYHGELLRSEVDLVIGERFLVSSHDADWSPLSGTVGRVGVQALLEGGPDYLLWAIVDSIVDGYLPVFDAISDEIDTLQDDVIRRPSSWILERLFQVKRDLLEIRHAVSPQREILNQLTTRDVGVVRPERVVYFRDIYDHLIRFTDELDTFRELVSTALDAYLSTVNNQLSAIMKRLTAITAILAGIGAVAGIFGMSEATAAFSQAEGPGFWIVSVVVILVGAVVWLYFRRIDWI